jgi:predicted O-methyltransferase YrrM
MEDAPPMRTPDYPAGDAARWSALDFYLAGLLTPMDAALAEALRHNADQRLPAHDVSSTQGKLLALFARMVGARRILEIGTLGGFSTIWMARALGPGGELVTIEQDPRHAEVARANIARAGLGDVVRLHVGPALAILPTLAGPFDLIFIDADKPNNPHYLDWALKLARPGTAIIGDNVVRGGAVLDGASADANVRGVRRFLELIANDPRLDATAIQTVGEKGWDGFALALVRDPSHATPPTPR